MQSLWGNTRSMEPKQNNRKKGEHLDFCFPHGFSETKAVTSVIWGWIAPSQTAKQTVLLWPGNHHQTEVVLTHRSGFGCYQDEVNNLLSLLPSFDKRPVSSGSIDLLLLWACWCWRDVLHVLLNLNKDSKDIQLSQQALTHHNWL